MGIEHKGSRAGIASQPASPGHAAGVAGRTTLIGSHDGEQNRPDSHSARAAVSVGQKERRQPNSVLKVIAYRGDGTVIKSWGSKAVWDGLLPQHYTGSWNGSRWQWNDQAARTVRVNTRLDGSGGEVAELWATHCRATSVQVFVVQMDAVTERARRAEDALDAHAPGHADGDQIGDGTSERIHPGGHGPGTVDGGDGAGAATHDAGTGGANGAGTEPGDDRADTGSAGTGSSDASGLDADGGITFADDELAADGDGGGTRDTEGSGGNGYHDGDPTGRTGKDTSTRGTGPGGEKARSDGGQEQGSSSTRDNQGTSDGDQDGQHGGSSNGRYGGEGKDGDDGVRGAGAFFGGLIGVPEALKGTVELALLIDAGDVTGAGGDFFKAGARKGLSASVAREALAKEARRVAFRETEATMARLIKADKKLALNAIERARVANLIFWSRQRMFFRGYLRAARAEARAARAALKRAGRAERAAIKSRLATAKLGEEVALAEPVAGRLPINHSYAGHEFPRSLLPAKYQKKGLRFSDAGFPEFEPYAMVLPNGKKSVRIEYQGTRDRDFLAANLAAGLDGTPANFTWHHCEEVGVMMLIPRDLHETVKHTGGIAVYQELKGTIGYGN